MSRLGTLALLGSVGVSCASNGGGGTQADDSSAPEMSMNDRVQELACAGELPVYEVCACEFTIDWSGVHEDMLGVAVEPSAFQTVALAGTSDQSPDEQMKAICAGTDPHQASESEYVDADVAGETEIGFDELQFLGTSATPFQVGQVPSLFLTDSDRPGMDVRVMALVSIVDGGSDTLNAAWP